MKFLFGNWIFIAGINLIYYLIILKIPNFLEILNEILNFYGILAISEFPKVVKFRKIDISRF